MGRFNPSYTGLGELLVSPEMVAAMRAKADKIKAAAEVTSPVGPLTDAERAHYRDSWSVDAGVRGEPSRRAYARVENSSDHAAAVEFGNGRTRRKTIEPHYTLTRAVDAAREL